MNKMPKTLDFGFGELTEVSYLEQVFGISRRAATKYLKVLRIKPVYIGGDVFFSLMTLKRILFVLCRPGGPGMVLPGSKMKNNPRLHKGTQYLTEVTDEILQQASDPKILLEMAAVSGENISALKSLTSKPVGRPKKEKANEKVC